MLRRFRLLMGALLVLTGIGLIVPSSVASAAPTAIDLAMVDGGGTLQLRGGEPFAIDTPTTLTGTADGETGVLSGLTFDTPDIAIERRVEDPLKATAFIDATFRQVSPGNGTVDSDGNVVAQLNMAVDLHVEVVPDGGTTPLPFPGDCTASPVPLILESEEAYDTATEQVTLVAEDFTIPPITLDPSHCENIYRDKVNEELAGSGHSLSLRVQGDLPIPPPPGCDTTTDLVASPAGSSPQGEELTLTSNVSVVAADPECVEAAQNGDILAGAVDFLRGSSIIGSGDLDPSGVATFTTEALPAGPQTLTARYRAVSPFNASTSAPLAHRITVGPAISTDIPTYIRLGEPTEFTVTVTNTGFGADLTDVAVVWSGGFGSNEPKLERFDGATWQVVPLSYLTDRYARLPEFDLPSGGTPHVERLRVSLGTPDLPAADPIEVGITMEVVPAASPLQQPPFPSALAAATARTIFISDERVPTTFDHSTPGQPIDTHTIRQGEMLSMNSFFVGPQVGGVYTAGTLEFLIDGQPAPAASWPRTSRPGDLAVALPVTNGGTGGSILIPLSPSIPIGERQLTVRYSGDAHHLPLVETYPFHVLPAQGPSYDCTAEGIPPIYFRVNVVAQANLPRAVEPGPIDLDNLDITLFTDRSVMTSFNVLYPYFELFEGLTNVGERGLKGVTFDVNDEEGTATGITLANPYPLDPTPVPAPNPDQVLDLDGEAGTTTIEGDPGDSVPVNLDSITLQVEAIGFPYTLVCTPVAQPASLGSVLVAGVDLTVTPDEGVREGDSVQLTADTGNAADAGIVEFLDGTDTIGVVPVSGGTATMSTDDLDAGDHTLKARFYAQPAAPVVVSPDVPLTVIPEFDCGAFTANGKGQIVRLVFMSLLERCPDQAGYDYWTEQLEDGASQEEFAKAISNTHEARRLVANDGFLTMLGRDGSNADLDFWATFLKTRPYRQLLATMGDAPEFRALGGSTDVGFVTRVYQQLVGRAPEPAGLEFWASRLRGGEPDFVMLNTFTRLREPTARVVIQSYQEILGRAPTSAELDTQVAFLGSKGDRSALYARLIGTSEFVVRSETLPNFPG